MNTPHPGQHAVLQLHITGADTPFCNQLLSGLRRENVPVSVTRHPLATPLTDSGADLWLLVDTNNRATSTFLSHYKQTHADIPLLLVRSGERSARQEQVAGLSCTVIPASGPSSLLETLTLHLCLQQEKKQSRFYRCQLKALEAQQCQLLDQSTTAFALLDGATHLYCNNAYTGLFDCDTREAMTGTALTELLAEKDRPAVIALLTGGDAAGHQLKVRTAAGNSAGQVQLAFSASSYESTACLMVEARLARSATAQKHGDKSQLTMDLITQLENLPHFLARIESAITAAMQKNVSSIVLVARIDRFKCVQEAIGKAATLKVLGEISEFLSTGINKPFSASRVAADEFGILLFDCKVAEGLRLADYIRSKVNVSLLPPTAGALDLSASIGLAVINSHTAQADDVITRARLNTGHAKKHQPLAGTMPVIDTLPDWIDQALDEQRLAMLFQPLVPLQVGAAQGYTVTFQLHDPDGKLLPQDAVMAWANMHHLAADLDKQVFTRLMARLHTSPLATPDKEAVIFQLPLASGTLAGTALLDIMASHLQQGNDPGQYLQCLISEIDLHSNREQVLAFCAHLDELGIRRVISDFGSAVDPLPALAAVKPCRVQLDVPLTRDLAWSQQQQHNLGKLINAVHHQQVAVTAAGVEDVTLLPLLVELGVDSVTGNCLQPPQLEPGYCFPVEQVICLQA